VERSEWFYFYLTESERYADNNRYLLINSEQHRLRLQPGYNLYYHSYS
jgi:hypothetical protein